MIRRIFAISLSGMLLITVAGFQSIHAQNTPDSQRLDTVRAQVAKIGIGEKAKVHVKLQDQTKLKGYISDASQDSFTVVDSKTGARTLAYSDVTEVRKQSGGISTLTWGIIAGAAAAAIIVGTVVVKPVLCDGGAGC